MATLKQVEKAKGQQAGLWLVMDGERIVGQLEKYNNTRTETHPWKAFSGTGFARKFIGAFYAEDGGKEAALEVILAIDEEN